MNSNVIIIGSGIAGLYSAYKIKKSNPSIKITILEKNSKAQVGGRMRSELFYGVNVVIGAGIGRKKKDKLLIKLLNELNIDYRDFVSSPGYANNIEKIDVENTFHLLQSEYKKLPNTDSRKYTFSQFAKNILGTKEYNKFIVNSGYTDYEREDVEQTLFNYGMEDNYKPLNGMGIQWNDLLEAIIKFIGGENIHYSSGVDRIEEDTTNTTNYIVSTNKGKYFCDKVIIATEISTVQKLLPEKKIYKQIHGQPFLRIYGKFTKKSGDILRPIINNHLIVKPPLQKIITMNAEKDVYMIAYSDNKSAEQLFPYIKNTKNNCRFLETLLEKTLGLEENILQLMAIRSYYWNEGTHYYSPIDKTKMNRIDFIREAQTPYKNMVVVGEAVSMNQGWVNGALDSVELAVTKNFINNK